MHMLLCRILLDMSQGSIRQYTYIYIYISHCPLGPQKCENNMKIKTNAYENNVMWHFHFISISFSMIFTFWGSPRSGSQISHYFHIPVHIVLFASYYDTGCFWRREGAPSLGSWAWGEHSKLYAHVGLQGSTWGGDVHMGSLATTIPFAERAHIHKWLWLWL